MLKNSISIPPLLLLTFATFLACPLAHSEPFEKAIDPLWSGDIQKRREFLEPENRPRKFQTAFEAFPYRKVAPAATPRPLKPAPGKPFSVSYRWKGEDYTIEDFIKRTHTSALLILKDDRIAYEKYLEGSAATTQFFSFSAAKSITSTLVGLAIKEGHIESIDDPLSKYLPFLTQGPYAGVTIKQALQMLAGVPFDEESYDFNNQKFPFSRVHNEAVIQQRYRFIEAANTLKRTGTPGEKWIYSTMNTALLGAVIENAAGQTLARFMEDHLWRSAGMEHPALWYLDGPAEIGREQAGGNFSATLRDFGRFGLLMLDGKSGQGKPIVPADWIKAATKPGHPALEYGKIMKDSELGYGYGWWLLENGTYMAQGVHGQFITVIPSSRVVIVKLSCWPEVWNQALELECYSFFQATAEALHH